MSASDHSSKAISLTRSYSFGASPITQKVRVEESFLNGKGQSLVRQYSCEQIYANFNNKTTVKQIEQTFLITGRKFTPSDISLTSATGTISNTSESLTNFQSNSDLNVPCKSFFGFSKKCPEQQGFEESLNHKRSREEIQENVPMEIDPIEESGKTSMADVHSYNYNYNISNHDNTHQHKVSRLMKPVSPKNSLKIRNSSDKNKLKTPRLMTQKSFENTSASLVAPPINNTCIQKCIKYVKLLAMLLIPILCGLIVTHTDHFLGDDSGISDEFNGENITGALRDLLYGQERVISELEDSFRNIKYNTLYIFTGGIGVGKTYTGNIIADNFQWKNNVEKIIAPQYKNTYYENKFMRTLSKNGYNLIIVDGLGYDDSKSVIPFVKKLLNTNSEKKVIIFLIFTIQEYSIDMLPYMNLQTISKEISTEFSNNNLDPKLITFDRLKEDVVRKCIRYSMAKKGLIINQYNIDHVLQNINFEYGGCKGVYSKVALLTVS